MNEPTSLTLSQGVTTMSSVELLELVNNARSAFDEKPVRHNDFVARCKDELDDGDYETFVIAPPERGGRPIEAIRMSADQCKLVAMRESKGVRRNVLARLNALETKAQVTQNTPAQLPVEVAARTFNALHSVGVTLGLQPNIAAISANQGTLAITGSNLLALIGHTHLEAAIQDIVLTPTQLGKELDGMSAVAFNRLLEREGYQTRVGGEWKPTNKAKGMFRLEDTGKKHNSGTPVMQLKWYSSILGQLKSI